MEHITNGDSKVMYCVAGGVLVGAAAMLGYVHVRPKPAACDGSGFKKSDGLTLKYWNGRGLMEIARLMLAKKNMYAGDYADIRVTTDSMDGYEKGNNNVVTYKSLENTLDSNLGRLPILECNGKSVGQSTAINYFVAKKLNLFGDNDMESSRIISVLSSLDELKSSYRKVIPYGQEPTEDMFRSFFDEPERDVKGPAQRANSKTRFFRWYCGRMEHSLFKESKWTVGTRMSLADIAIYRELYDTLEGNQAHSSVKPYRREPFSSRKNVLEALKSYPKLLNVCEMVRSDPSIKKHIEGRQLQRF